MPGYSEFRDAIWRNVRLLARVYFALQITIRPCEILKVDRKLVLAVVARIL